ncbi:aldehyde oxidase [Achromobacter sp. HZ01]|uniref:xanthine dehydrogenase family protein molybdopterin-binding subunit n=1 Tax=Achromobacter sp. HZ01 TaxID=1416886 RepID=UPI000DC54549|nr:molybdopterin cofactor-binding domain-containing protein [Achromobacter sp. HZ01]RAP65024.1 aldehyde oxidase [Achromobacter sp. HZ01]
MSKGFTRRDFLWSGVVSGIAVALVKPARLALAAAQPQAAPLAAWDAQAGRMRHRIDALAKVTGAKTFGFDMRAIDQPEWPQTQSHAMILRVTRADGVFAGIDLGVLGAGLQPDRVVTAQDLKRDGVVSEDGDFLLPEGSTPAYLGQAVAILIWHDFARFRAAKSQLKSSPGAIRFVGQGQPLERDPWASLRYVRVGAADPLADDVYSSFKDKALRPARFVKQVPEWAHSDAVDAAGLAHAQAIAEALERPGPGELVVGREYFSQSIEPAPLETDNGNCWYDRKSGTLHAIVASQAPQELLQQAAHMLAASRHGVRRILMTSCHTVGYGAKEASMSQLMPMLAALYADGRPLRLANDRYEQFQFGTKRHSFRVRYRIAVDRESGKFQIFQANLVGNGGGRRSGSPIVGFATLMGAQSLYYFPRSDLMSTMLASRAVDAAAVRGVGMVQSIGATEMLVDEIAQELGLDPIELRLRNVMRANMKNTQGAVPGGELRGAEVLKRMRAHVLWQERHRRKSAYEAEHPGRLYGVGAACAYREYGNGADAAFAGVALTRDGRIELRHVAVEIGTGSTTSQACACAKWLGRPADVAEWGQTRWPELPMVASENPRIMSQATQDRLAQDPYWTPYLSSPSSASNSAYYFSHTTIEASRFLFMHGLWPAAVAIWSRGIGGGQWASSVVRPEEARWVGGRLTAGGMTPLPLEELARKAYELNLVTGVAVHDFSRAQWTESDFELPSGTERWQLDGLAIRRGDGSAPDAQGTPTANGYRFIARTRAAFPAVRRNDAGFLLVSTLGVLAEVAVEKASGKVEILRHHSVLECGNQIVPELVSGQLQGGAAMGIGHALHEYLPLYEDGPGNGTWNFNRYRLPRARDVAVWTQTAEILPPLSGSDPFKGIGELSMMPIVPALANAIAHATGHRFRELPISPDKILAALQAPSDPQIQNQDAI